MSESKVIFETPLSPDEQKLINFAELAKLIKIDLNSNKNTQYSFIKNFNKDTVMAWLANPNNYEKQLRDLSNFLYTSSSHYKKLVNYFAELPLYAYYVEPMGIDLLEEITPELKLKLKKQYYIAIKEIDSFNLEHEFDKISHVLWLEDVFYGYEYTQKDSYFIDKLDPNRCKISSIEDGVFNFSFDFSYFNTHKEKLDMMDQEFKEKYNIYLHDKKNMKWQELNPEKTICIKINTTTITPIPPFSGIFEELYDIEDYKSLKLAATELENYMILVEKIPYLKTSTDVNQFALGLDKAIEYHKRFKQEVSSRVGTMLSPFESVEAISMQKKDARNDNVADAENALYNAAGTSKTLFNSSDATGAALTKSVIVDEGSIFSQFRQLERWFNRKLKYLKKKFKFHLIDMTRQNKDDFINLLKDATSVSLPVKTIYANALGMSPSTVANMEYLENKILDISDNWTVLQSSFQQSGDAGRPAKNENNLTPAGEKTREKDANNKKDRK